jgi:K+-sensing histidine kinase KdpD
MFKKLKQMLTLEFVVLSLAVYASLSALGIYLVYFDLTKGLDEELGQVVAMTRKLVVDDGKTLYLTTFPTEHHKIRLKVVVELFDANKKHSGSYGVPGPEVFVEKPTEIKWDGHNWRCLTRPITRGGEVIGYIQVEAPTKYRDLAISKLLEKCLLMAPLLILGLALCGYAFSGRAIKPVEHTYKLQKRFLADAGHELKTPISIMLATLDNLRKDFANDKSSAERIDKAKRSARRMDKLVLDLIYLTKTEQYSEPAEQTTIQLDMLLREVMGELEDLFEYKDVSLKGSAIESVQVLGNRDAIHTAFANLIKNAMQYTYAGGSVTVTLARQGNSAVVKIADTGVGISEADLKRVFDRFFSAERTKEIDRGSGLGLTIVKAVIERHHGAVSVVSEVGKGTTFTVRLPSV